MPDRQRTGLRVLFHEGSGITMASVSGTSSSSANSIYGTRNVISGLASGMDTEGMIENAISAYKNKISSLGQQRTKLSWQQEAYRDIISKMAGFSSKYTSYTSATNLMSSSFFNQAVRTVTNGANASKVSASGRGTSDVSINAVKQLATAATYKLSGSALLGGSDDGYASAAASKGFSLDKMIVSSFYGTMSLTYGKDQNLSFTFSEGDVFEKVDDLVKNMNKQLESQTISLSGGGGKKASDMLEVKANGNTIFFQDKAGNKVYISSVSDSMKSVFGVETGEGNKSFQVPEDKLTREVDAVEYMETNPMTITLDGVTKSIKMPTAEELNKRISELEEGGTSDNGQIKAKAYVELLQKSINKAFGTLDNNVPKLKVSNLNEDGKLQLQFKAGQVGSTFAVTSSVGKSMGFGGTQLTSYINTNKTLKDLLGEEKLSKLATGTDKDGNTTYAFTINGVKIGDFTEKTELSTIISRINNNKEAGVNVTYSKLTNEFTFTAKETGRTSSLDFSAAAMGSTDGKMGLAAAIFGSYDADDIDKTSLLKQTVVGQDAIFTATVNGKEMELTRSSNIVDFDGLSVTLKGTFGYQQATNDDGSAMVDEKEEPVYTNKLDRTAEKVTFTTSTDSDKIVDTIKSFVEDYNEMVTQIKNAYSTLPVQRSNGRYYDPLTDDDKADMSESAIKEWEDKAKTGLLFGDRDLSSLYSRLTSAISMYGQDLADLKAAGITVNYSDGLSTLSFNENTLRDTLDSDPDRVRDIFTRSKSNGAATNGLVAAIKEPLDVFGATTGAVKGTLVEKAGSPLAPTSIYSNYIQKQLDQLDSQIEKWQDKMSDQVDYYTSQFSKLEQLIAQMNSQSSTLAQLMGGY